MQSSFVLWSAMQSTRILRLAAVKPCSAPVEPRLSAEYLLIDAQDSADHDLVRRLGQHQVDFADVKFIKAGIVPPCWIKQQLSSQPPSIPSYPPPEPAFVLVARHHARPVTQEHQPITGQVGVDSVGKGRLGPRMHPRIGENLVYE